MSGQPIDPAEEYTLEISLDGELLERGRLSRIDHAGMGPLDKLIAEDGPVILSDYLEDWAIYAELQGEPLQAQILHGWPWPARPLPVMTHELEPDDEPDDAGEDDEDEDDVAGGAGERPAADHGEGDRGPGPAGVDRLGAGTVPAGETATLDATCAYLTQLAAHIRRDIDPQLELADGVLRERGLDPETLTDLGRVRELLTAVGTALTSLAAAVRDRHGHIADAINSAPADPADTRWYRASVRGGETA